MPEPFRDDLRILAKNQKHRGAVVLAKISTGGLRGSFARFKIAPERPPQILEVE